MVNKPSALLFDMDGVLVDSLDSWWQALNQAMKTYTNQELTRDAFIKKYWGHDLRDNLKKAGLPPEIAPFCNTIYGDHVDAVYIYPETKPALRALHHYKKGIITNTPRECAQQILKKFDIIDYFDVIVTSDEVPQGKPNPEIVLKACTHLRVDPSSVFIIGDTESDIQAGKSAGCVVIGVNIKADYTIKNLSELPILLQTIEKKI